MFNSDSGSKPNKVKLPKPVMMMVEKGNIVMAIKTLATDENISMEVAKERIDIYETMLKAQQQQKLSAIANKQGIPNSALNFDKPQPPEDTGILIKDKVTTTPSEQDFKSLQTGLDNGLTNMGYKKPLIPYWMKRVLIIILIMAGLSWIFWRIFG